MKPDKNNVEQFLDRYLPSASKEEMEVDGAHVLQQLRLEADPQSEAASERTADPDFWRAGRAWWQLLPIRAAAAFVFLALLAVPLMKMFVFPEKVYAIVEKVTGSVYQVSDGKQRVLTGGERIETGTPVRTNGAAGAVLKLPDGAQIEMHPKSELLLERATDGVNIRLNDGSVNVTPAKEPAGKLYVQNREGTVPVVGAMSQSAAASAPVAAAQNPAVPPRLEFEVASVKLTTERSGGLACQGIDGTASEGNAPSSNVTGGARGRCVGRGGLRQLVALAYGVSTRNVIGNEGWAGPPFPVFQIEAKAPDTATATTAQLRQMLQGLLVVRFKLKSHREIQESQQSVLTVSRSGHKLQPTSDPEEPPRLAPPGLLIRGKSEVGKLADFLIAMVGFPVVDRTGLAGRFDYALRLNIVAGQRGEGGGGGGRGGGGGGGGISVTEFDPPISVALQDQLGLRLESQKVSVEMLIIDEAEKPSEN
jgi:uncharacterized protein (TIGR03435 family)